MPCEIYTCQMSLMKKYPELQAYAVDITVKSGNRAFAPTWDIVMAIKNGTISEDEYIRRYRELMRKSYVHNRKAWKDLLSRRLVILMCYCSTNMFCHRHLLAEYLRACGATYGGELTNQSVPALIAAVKENS